MKKLLTLILLFIAINVQAQEPEYFYYDNDCLQWQWPEDVQFTIVMRSEDGINYSDWQAVYENQWEETIEGYYRIIAVDFQGKKGTMSSIVIRTK